MLLMDEILVIAQAYLCMYCLICILYCVDCLRVIEPVEEAPVVPVTIKDTPTVGTMPQQSLLPLVPRNNVPTTASTGMYVHVLCAK